MTNLLTVATRSGKLALTQTEIVIAALKKIHPDLTIKIRTITTAGDRDRRTTLWKLKTTGFFTSQLEDALVAGQADFAVHSFKDLPTRPRDGLTVAAVCDRRFPQDCLIAAAPARSIEQLPPSAKTGTSSLRRIAQTRRLRPDLQLLSIRGNVPTRIKRLDEGKFDAVILARAGIERLGLGDRISLSLDPAEFIPAPAQGALAVQTRTDDPETTRLLADLDNPDTRTATSAERHILTVLQCGCHAPVGAFAKISKNDIMVCAFISDIDGKNFIRAELKGPAENAQNLAEKIANDLLNAGGQEILRKLQTL